MSTLAKIHIGKKTLGLADDDYRDLLERATGKRSSAGMSEAERGRVLDAMKALGFKPVVKAGGAAAAGKTSKPYVRLIHALWGEAHRAGAINDGSLTALSAFCKRQTGISVPAWLGPEEANKVTEGLKIMLTRARKASPATDATR